jgi:hypothetical protein
MEKKPPLYYFFVVLAGVAGVALLVVAKESVEAIRDRMLGDETPQQLTASELLANGAEANRHVTLTEVAVGPDFVMRSGVAEKKNETYLVVSPPGVRPGTPGKTLIVHVTRFQDYAEAQSNPHSRSFTGFFTPDETLPPAQKKMLGEKYPGLALDRIPYLEVRDYKGTSGFSRALTFAAVGVPLMAVGVVGMVVVSRRTKRPAAPARAKRARG